MKKSILLFFISVIIAIPTFSQITVKKNEGSSVVTKLTSSIKVNNGSSLLREKIVINDAVCPIQINDVGILSLYSSTRSGYTFNPEGNFITKEPIVAFEIYHVLYDVFGEHMKTLSNTEVSDIEGQFTLTNSSSWYASENDVKMYFTCVSYVANIRTKSGSLWHYNYKAIKDQLDILKISFEEGYIPKKDSDKEK